MIRTIIGVAVAVALLATLFLRFGRDAGSIKSFQPAPNDNAQAPQRIVEATPSTADESDSVPISAPLRTEPNIMALITRQRLPDIVSPPWSDEMEATILSYIAQRPGLQLTSLQVQCAEEGCVILLVGRDVPIYQMDFDVFAEAHGFAGAIIGGDATEARTVALPR